MERHSSEKSMSSRSEDEVFSDAATQFQDSRADKDLTSAISFKDCEDNDILQSPRNSADGSDKENSIQKIMPILPMGTPENHDIGLSCSRDSGDKNGSASDVVSIETEILICVPEESMEVGDGASAAACSVVQLDNVVENQESKLNENLSSDSVQPSKHAFKIFDTESISEKGPNVTSDMVELKEDFSDRLSSKSSMSGNDEQEIDGKGNPGVSFEENLMDASIKSDNTKDLTSETSLADKIVELEENGDKLALIDDLSTTDTFDIQTDAAHNMESSIVIDSNEADEKKEREKESVYVLSVPDDFPAVDYAEINLQGFKDHKSGNNEAIVEKKLVGGKADLIQIYKGSSALTPVDADDLHQTGFLGNMTDDVPDAKHVSINTDSTSESISIHYQSRLQSDRISNSQDNKNESKISSYNKLHGEFIVEDRMASPVDNNSERNKFERTSINHVLEKELIHAGAVNDGHTGEPGAAASQTSVVILQGEANNVSVNPQHDTTVGDVLIETSSRTDSLEGHWGSISVLSTQSDNQAAIDPESLPSTGSQALSEAEKVNLKKSKVASEEQPIDECQPPSFMTLVEHGGSDRKAVATSETPGSKNPRAGWFPSLSHMANESQGRKKNEEIIEKVANWNANQHSALKNLANGEPKPKSPNSNQNPNPDVLGARDVGAVGAKVNSTEGPETPMAEPTNVEAEKEWDSPARYPSDIKRDKRKVKGKPFWVQFACCSSVN